MGKSPFCHCTVHWAKSYNIVFVFDIVLHFHRTLRVCTKIRLAHWHCFIVHFFGAFFTPITFWGHMSISISDSISHRSPSSHKSIIERQTVSVCCLFALGCGLWPVGWAELDCERKCLGRLFATFEASFLSFYGQKINFRFLFEIAVGSQ